MAACKRCGDSNVAVISRQEEFCKSCFLRFVMGKVRRQLEDFKIDFKTGQVASLVLPVDLRLTNIVLIDMLVDIIRGQRLQHSKQGFAVTGLFINSLDDDTSTAHLERLREMYPEVQVNMIPTDQQLSSELLSKFSRTSAQDLESEVKDKMFEKFVREEESSGRSVHVVCDWSMTEIAGKVLSYTAKGKGVRLGSLTDGKITPLCEVFAGEIDSYATLKDIHGLAVPKKTIPHVTKLRSIDELVGEYFTEVEKSFPSVVATTVRTANKLAVAPLSDENCKLCGRKKEGDSVEWINKIAVSANVEDNGLCYSCIRIVEGQSSQDVSTILAEVSL